MTYKVLLGDCRKRLSRLVTPPNGTILDPFTGSGSTGKAAMLESFDFIGIEQDKEYIEIARTRIKYAQQQARKHALVKKTTKR